MITSLSTAASNPLIVTSPSVATGTPFKNSTEYSKISPAAAAVTVPEERSTVGEPESAGWSIDLRLTLDASETPFNVIVLVLSFVLPKVTTVSPLISEATSTFVVPPVAYAAAESEEPYPPRRTIVSELASKPVIMTFPSFASVTDPLESKVTSYR